MMTENNDQTVEDQVEDQAETKVEDEEVQESSEETVEEELVDEGEEEQEVPEDQKPPITELDIKLVEAILFASPAPIDVRTIAERVPDEKVCVIADILEILKEHYKDRGINLVKRDKRWAFRTSEELAELMRIEKESVRKFTRAAMETMAIIAYHQPVTRAEIENIRGVSISSGSLDALVEAGWVKPGKRRQVPGRPVTWMTTKNFLDHFGLESVKDLPGMDELKEAGLLDKRPAIDTIPTADLFDGDINKGREMEDPQEVTDEDLLGKMDDEGEVDSLPSDDDTETAEAVDNSNEEDKE